MQLSECGGYTCANSN